MPHRYLPALGLAALLLAGCNRAERSTETPAAPGRPAASAPLPAADSLAATDNAAPARNMSLLLEPTDAASPGGAAGTAPSAASRPAPVRQPAAVALPAAASAPLADAVAPAAADSAAGNAATASTAELRAFLQTGLPAPSTFAVRPNRDTLLRGPQGTQVLLPADAFDLPDADSAAVVQLTLREFYADADIVLAGLNTQAGPRLLETGGMVHLAATANGRPVQLRPGMFVHLRMPAGPGQGTRAMRVFQGVASGPAAPATSWQEPPLLRARPVATLRGRRLRGRWGWGRRSRRTQPGRYLENREPEYAHSERAFRRDLADAITINYSDALRARLRKGRRVPRAERLALAHATDTYHERVLRIVAGKLQLDSTGVFTGFETKSQGEEKLLAAVQQGVRRLPHWQPATYTEYPAPTLAAPAAAVLLRDSYRYQLPSVSLPTQATPGPVARRATLYFTASGRVHAELEPWLLNDARFNRENRRRHQVDKLLETSRQRADSLYATNPVYYDSLYRAHVRWRDSLNAAERRRAANELARLRTQFTDTSRADITRVGVYNELSSQGLNWINCDRYLGPGPLITYKVNASRPGAIVTLLFKKYRSVMSGEERGALKTAFGNVPAGTAATVVAIRRENGVTYLATQATRLGLPLLALSYAPVTMDELRARLATAR